MEPTFVYYRTICKDPYQKFANAVRARARHHYGRPISVRQLKGGIELSLKNPRTGEIARETFFLERFDLQEMYADSQAFYEHADRVIERFLFPVIALEVY